MVLRFNGSVLLMVSLLLSLDSVLGDDSQSQLSPLEKALVSVGSDDKHSEEDAAANEILEDEARKDSMQVAEQRHEPQQIGTVGHDGVQHLDQPKDFADPDSIPDDDDWGSELFDTQTPIPADNPEIKNEVSSENGGNGVDIAGLGSYTKNATDKAPEQLEQQFSAEDDLQLYARPQNVGVAAPVAASVAAPAELAGGSSGSTEPITGSSSGEPKSSSDSQIESAPAYNKIVPIIGWNRYSGDSANSIGGWCRWWKYLRIKNPITMDWVNGLKLKIYPNNEVFRAIFIRGIYDPNPIVVANALLPSGGVFIDVGANMGYFSLLLSLKLGDGGTILAIEPSKRDFDRLVENIRVNHLGKVIHPYKLAIDEKYGVVKLVIAGEERSALNTVGTEFSTKGVEKINIEEVKAVTIDDIVQHNQLQRVDMLKLDVEGSELKALSGAVETIKTYRPSIMLGVNENSLKACNTNRAELQKFIQDLGYEMYKITETPKFVLELVSDLANESVKIVFCLPKGTAPPLLEQPEQKTIMDIIKGFFR